VDPTADARLDAAIEQVAETAPMTSLVGKAKDLPASTLRAMSDIGDRVTERVMTTPHRVDSAADALDLLGEIGDGAKTMQGVLATGLVTIGTRLIRIGRMSKMPTVALLTGTAAVASSVRGGIGELQVLGSFLTSRLEDAGIKADPDFIRRVTLEVYLNPSRAIDLDSREDLGASRLLSFWLRHSGAIPILLKSRTDRQRRAWIDAIDRLDLPALWAEWQSKPRPAA
jgi:hypothetical protein